MVSGVQCRSAKVNKPFLRSRILYHLESVWRLTTFGIASSLTKPHFAKIYASVAVAVQALTVHDLPPTWLNHHPLLLYGWLGSCKYLSGVCQSR